MSSTNKTANYNLSQYIGSDKPTYLSDYNSDMYNIDAQMKTNADNVATALSGVTTATNTANTAQSTATTANTTANTALTTAGTTATALNTFMQKWNLSSITTWGQNDITITGVGFSAFEECNFTVAKNSDGSIFKCYGSINGTTNGSGNCYIELSNTGILVDEPYVIYPVGVCSPLGANADMQVELAIANNKITIRWWNYEAGHVKVSLFPCIYFNADFGDNPSSNS